MSRAKTESRSKPKPKLKSSRPRRTRVATRLVPVVGVGASAGGLEALEKFFAGTLPGAGIAYVVIQHMDPTQPSALAEILQRATDLPVREVEDGVLLRPDQIWVGMPGKDVTLRAGKLLLSRPALRRGLRLPIDHFFASLAQERGEDAVGVVCSGMGADGTVGLRAIRDAGGLTFAQDPDTAKFSDMPRSAINAGVVDFVGAPAELAARVQLHAPVLATPGEAAPLDAAQSAAFQSLLHRVRAETGRDFSEYKPTTLLRRIQRRMAAHKLASLADYAQLVEREPTEVRLLSQTLLIGVTAFLREAAVWQCLADKVLPKLVAAVPVERGVRAWVPACSTGEEAYTVAMLLVEATAAHGARPSVRVRVFATDIDPEAIEAARIGLYPATIAAQVSAERLQRFFTREGTNYRVRPTLRELLVFSVHDVTADPPFAKLDLLSCRNLLNYLTPELQQRLCRTFHYCLNTGGVLILGGSEALCTPTGAFTPIDATLRIFRRLAGAHKLTDGWPAKSTPRVRAAAPPPARAADAPTAQVVAERTLLRHFGPPAMITNDAGDILHIIGRIGKFFEPSSGKASLNVYGMARSAVRRPLAAALRGVSRSPGRVVACEDDLPRRGEQRVRVTARWLAAPPELRGLVLLVFEELPATPMPTAPRSKAQRDLTIALRRAEREVHDLRLEALSSREALGSANEELQAMNEELQSANEELTTSKEETQSMNEELQSVNAEQQAKLDNLARINGDLRNLLESTDIAILFLDADLHIRRFTRHMTRVIRLIPGDIGRLLTDIKSDLIYPDLEKDVHGVLRTLAVSEKQVVTADGRWFDVRIMPYRALDESIDGVVVTFSDISTAKELEHRLRTLNLPAPPPASKAE